ncbi:hypothetical protein GCM10027456_00120 [Kineosporia babensis]
MSGIGDLAKRVGGLAASIDEAIDRCDEASQKAQDVVNALEALGAQASLERADQAKDDLARLTADLKGASAQAGQTQALIASLSTSGSGASGASPGPMSASTDPTAVPTPVQSRNSYRSKKVKKPGAAQRAATRAAKKVEDAEDLVGELQDRGTDFAEKVIKAPEPPTNTSAGTHEAASGSAAPGPGIEAPSLASAGIGLGVVYFGAREMARRRKRAFQTPQQFPEGEEPPPT